MTELRCEDLRTKPFQAVVGIDSAQHYRDLSKEVAKQAVDERFGLRTYDQLGRRAVGLLMTEKTGLLCIPNRHGAIYPMSAETEAIAGNRARTSIFQAEPMPLIVHYNTDHPEVVGEQLNRAILPIHSSVDGIQVNGLDFGEQMDSLSSFRVGNPNLMSIPLIVQINKNLLDEYTPSQLAAKIKQQFYGDRVNYSNCNGVISYVWLDPSGGLGNQFDPEKMIDYISAIRQETPQIGIGVAGGLDYSNLSSRMLPILEKHPDISWDTQSGVQNEVNGRRQFSTIKAAKFLIASENLRQQVDDERAYLQV
ncbi:MAG TPA: hypothetical protein VMR16_00895 [Candidatus Saccharimonadales bacterium]|nr:hypothetical protein [Candidatus Saccharimonadales bacterium]